MKIPGLPSNKIASVSDAKDPQFSQAFRKLENFSNRYIKEMVAIGGYPATYPWPVDNLHNWSRWWEYAFTWLHLKELVKKRKKLKILDIGPALTFWPFFLAETGFEITAIDIDQRIKSWGDGVLARLRCINWAEKRRLEFVTGDIAETTIASDSFDAITNISVIEHVEKKEQAMKEVHRLLKPGGKLINTLDISLDGKRVGDSQPLSPQEGYKFIRLLDDTFGGRIQFDFTHPMDMVTPRRYPKKFADSSLYVSKLHLLRQMWKVVGSRLSMKFLLNPNRLDMWTVAGIAVQKSSIKR